MTMCDKDVLGIIDMVHELAKHGIKATYEYVRDMSAYRIIAKEGDWYIAKYVKEFKPLSDPEIPITFYAEERRYVLNSIIEEFKRKKEKEMANNIEWKVDNITVDRRFGEADTFKAEIFGRMNGVVVGDYADIANGLQKKLNAPERKDEMDAWTYVMAGGRQNGKTLIQFKMYAKMLGIDLGGKLPAITKVIFNNPATIVIWADDTKTVVKAQNNELFDPEKGLAMAITKKALGNEGNYFDVIKKHVGDIKPEYESKIKKLKTDIHLAHLDLQYVLKDKKATKADLIEAMQRAIHYLERDKD